MSVAMAVIDLTGTTVIDVAAVCLTTAIIFGILGPKLWRELCVARRGED